MKKYTLGLAMIVYNEERALQGWVDNVKDYISEYAISVDSKTTDNTENILKHNNIEYSKFTFQNSFSIAFNECVKKLQTDWILCLAPDERIIKESLDSLQLLIQKCEEKNIDAVAFPRRHWLDLNMEKEFTQWYPDLQIRLVKNFKNILFQGQVHESFQGYNKLVQFLEIHIEHFNLCKEFCPPEKWAKKNELYRSLGG